MTNSPSLSALLDFLLEHLDIPKSYYDKAAARHRSLGKWLHRPESTIAAYDPDVRPQGSFRYGTVIRPINEGDEYDLDNVCVFNKLDKCVLTQEELKRLYGEEVKAYAKANGMLAPVTEHNRCWRLCYADEVSFHLDTLPCVPEDNLAITEIAGTDVPIHLAKRAVAITDKRHPKYRKVCSEWLSSNPRGFAAWFEQRAALGRQRRRGSSQIHMAVEDVPPYEWKTTLQRSIQILKRHRDIMFKDEPDLAPISMIITNLAARAYQGEEDIATALNTIVAGMPQYVREARPRVPNPADPREDYADKWARDARLETNFWSWWTAVKSDLATLSKILGTSTLHARVERTFEVRLTQEQLDVLEINTMPTSTAATMAPTMLVPSAVRPWSSHE